MKHLTQFVGALGLALLISGCHDKAHDPMESHTDHAQARAHATPEATQVPSDKKFVPDSSLHEGMARVRKAVETLQHMEHGHLDAGQVRATSDEIQAAVDFMFANCKLDPEADAALHPLLARVLTANEALRKKPEDATPLVELRSVIDQYPQVFEDSDWNEVKEQEAK